MNARGIIALAVTLGSSVACQTMRGEPTTSAPPAPAEQQQEGVARQEAEELRPGERVITGTVSSVYGDTIFVMNELGRTELIRVVPETRITVGGREAQLSQVEEGQELRATYTTREGQNMGVRITAAGTRAAPR